MRCQFKRTQTSRRPIGKAKACAGFSLIEVLVTIVVLSFGLLGVAGLLVSGVSNAAGAEATAKASQLIGDMADRIRANPAQALAAGGPYQRSFGAAVPSGSDIAERDVQLWLKAIQAQLPAGDGEIQLDSAAGSRKLRIAVRWSMCMGGVDNAERNACLQSPETAFRTMVSELSL